MKRVFIIATMLLAIPMTLRPYGVKHSVGGEAYRVSRDIRAVQELLGLSRLELADRYAHAAIAPAVALAAAKFGAAHATAKAARQNRGSLLG